MVFKTCLIQFSPIESKFLQDALLCKACKACKALNFDLYWPLLLAWLRWAKCGNRAGWKKQVIGWSGVRPCQAMSGHVLLWRCGLVHVIDLLHRNLNTSEQKLQGTLPNVQKHKLENQSFFHMFSIHFFINQPLWTTLLIRRSETFWSEPGIAHPGWPGKREQWP